MSNLQLGPEAPWELGNGGEHEINLNIFAAFEGFCRERRRECDRLGLHGCMDINQLSSEFFLSLIGTYGDGLSQRDAFLFEHFRDSIQNVAKIVGDQSHDDGCGTERPGWPYNSTIARREYNIERMKAAVERLVPAMKKWDVPFDSETGNARKTILNMTEDMYLSAAWKWAFELERLEIDPIIDLPDPYKGHYRKSHLPDSILELYYATSERPSSYEQRLEEAIIMIEHCKGNVLNFLKESEFAVAMNKPWVVLSRYRSNHRKDRVSAGDPIAPPLKRPNAQRDYKTQRENPDTVMDAFDTLSEHEQLLHEVTDIEPLGLSLEKNGRLTRGDATQAALLDVENQPSPGNDMSDVGQSINEGKPGHWRHDFAANITTSKPSDVEQSKGENEPHPMNTESRAPSMSPRRRKQNTEATTLGNPFAGFIASNTKVTSSFSSGVYSTSPDMHYRANQFWDMDSLMDGCDFSGNDTHGSGTQYVTDLRSQQPRRDSKNLPFVDTDEVSSPSV